MPKGTSFDVDVDWATLALQKNFGSAISLSCTTTPLYFLCQEQPRLCSGKLPACLLS